MYSNIDKKGMINSNTELNFEKILLYSILILGFILALVQYFYNRSLWLDEAMLAKSIISYDSLDFFKPLLYDQVAPLLFLQIEKLFYQLIPNSEYGLRLFPLLCYFGALYFFFRTVKILFINIYSQITTLTIFVFNTVLIYYSSEMKQYMTDVFVLCLVNHLLLRDYKFVRNKYLLLVVVGVISIFLSNVAVITLFASGIYWIYREFGKIKISIFLVVFSSWGISFITYYLLFIFDHPAKNVMLDFWSGANAFLPRNPFTVEFYSFLIEKTQIILGVLSNSKFPVLGVIFSLVLLTGLLNSIKKLKPHGYLILFLLPVLTHLTLSVFKLYPFDKRLILYMIPNFMIMLGYGFDMILRWLTTKQPLLNLRVIVVIVSVCIGFLFYFNEFPRKNEELKQSMNFMTENLSVNDEIYVYYGAFHAFNFYQSINYHNFKNTVTIGTENKDNKEEYINELIQLKGQKWVLFSHIVDNEDEYIVKHLQLLGEEKLKTFQTKGSSAYLFSSHKK